MEDQRRKLLFVFSLICILFVAIIIYMSYFQVVKAKTVADNPNNLRFQIDENAIRRGKIYDRNGNIIVQTEKMEDGSNRRIYNKGAVYSHITGYHSITYGKSGLEQNFDRILLDIDENTPFRELKNLVINKEEGNGLKLSINTELQEYAYGLMEGHKGSMVLMNPKTGEIYTMVSRPAFDPSNVAQNWEELINNEDSPLLNRSTQGLYTPGSTFKVLSSIVYYENQDKLDLNYMDTGEEKIGGFTYTNYDKKSYGEVNLTDALAHSINTYYANKSQKISPEIFKGVLKRVYFDQEIPFDLPTNKSISPFKSGMSATDLAAASFGQGSK